MHPQAKTHQFLAEQAALMEQLKRLTTAEGALAERQWQLEVETEKASAAAAEAARLKQQLERERERGAAQVRASVRQSALRMRRTTRVRLLACVGCWISLSLLVRIMCVHVWYIH